MLLIERNEPGRRARFVKKSDGKDGYQLNAELKAKAQRLLGIKGYVPNIAQTYLTHVLNVIADHKVNKISELLPSLFISMGYVESIWSCNKPYNDLYRILCTSNSLKI